MKTFTVKKLKIFTTKRLFPKEKPQGSLQEGE